MFLWYHHFGQAILWLAYKRQTYAEIYTTKYIVLEKKKGYDVLTMMTASTQYLIFRKNIIWHFK